MKILEVVPATVLATFNSPTFNIRDDDAAGLISVHVNRTAGGTVQMMGRNNPNHPFGTLGAAISSNTIINIPRAAEIMAAVTVNTGTVTVSIAY